MAPRMADRIAAERRRQFVGRQPETRLFLDVLEGVDDGAVIFLHGPGGVGKTTLLRRFADLARSAGREVAVLDGRDVAPLPAAVLAALVEAAGAGPADPGAVRGLGERTGLVVLLDTAELLAPCDRWLREELLPSLAADAVVVLAGREPPSIGWRTDPGWRDLVRSVGLRNLSPEESRTFLALRGVPDDACEEALAFTRGHPLALALVADVTSRGGGFTAVRTPEVVGTLLAALVDTVPSARHRAALDACAQVLATTEPLLAALLEDEDVHEVFEWLRGLSVVQSGPRGLYPHDVARDALGAELRWRHPEAYAEVHRRAGAHYRGHFYAVDPDEQQQVLVDYVFLHRDNPVLGPLVTRSAVAGTDLGSLELGPVREEERGLARAMVERHEGAESADLVEYWMDRQPGCVLLVRGPDGDVLGLVATVALQGTTADDVRRDPAVAAATAYLRSRAPLRDGDVAGFFRFWMQRDAYQDLGPVQLFITLHFVRYYMSTPRLARTFVYYAAPDAWAGICAYADVERVPEADFTVGGRSYGVFTHDWRARPPLAWLELLGEREIARRPLLVPPGRQPAAAVTVELDRAAFEAAVRDALRGYGRAEGLRSSPLLGSALAAARTAGDAAGDRDRADALKAAIRDAASRLEASPRDRRGFRALHHTYLQPAATQAEAADLLDLPTTTYRRHLAAGVQRLAELLWQDELDARRSGRTPA